MTLDETRAQLQKALDAYNRALASPEQFSVSGAAGGSRMQIQHNLQTLGAEVERWQKAVKRLERGGVRVRRGVPYE
jgi:hypothetical protein